MSLKKMRVRIGRDGGATITVEGGEGEDCLAFTRALEDALGKVVDRTLTADYAATDPLSVRAHEEVEERGL